MRLIKLTVAGFKSFADKTEFTFEAPITGIVGPNGCGKSNVVDAIKWVLGERSSKSLRGTEMIDVIFAGSASRKPLGLASVMLTFENPLVELGAAGNPAPSNGAVVDAVDIPHLAIEAEQAEQADGAGEAPSVGDEPVVLAALAQAPEDADRSPMFMAKDGPRRRGLPIDTDHVEVERRLYRDGASEYLINGRKARLKDIRDLFLDTGVGADAYCIIEQGKVDAMLLASPMERRNIFEEAAGVAKFRLRKAEAERKLERTDTNLIRAREQLESTERRLRMVKSQAEKARIFRTLDEQYQAVRMALLVDQYHALAGELATTSGQLEGLTLGRTAAQARVAELETQRQEADLTRHELADSRRRTESELQAAQHAQETANQRGRHAERAAESTRRQLDADQQGMLETDARIAEISSGMDKAADHVAALSEEQALAEVAMNNLGTARSAIVERAAEQRSEASRRRITISNIDRERAGMVAAVEQDQRRASVLHEQVARLRQKAEFSARDKQGAIERVALLSGQVDELRRRQAELEVEFANLASAGNNLTTERRSVADKLGELEQHVARTETRRSALEEMVQQRIGLDEAVRGVLIEKAKGGRFASVRGLLADLVDADLADAAAVEAALGAALQALVVPQFDETLSSDDLATVRGPVSFISELAAPGMLGLLPDREAEFASAVAALPLVRMARPLARPRMAEAGSEGAGDRSGDGSGDEPARGVTAILDRLLGRTIFVRDLDTAMMLAAGPLATFAGDRAGVRFVIASEGGPALTLESDGRLVSAGAGSRGSAQVAAAAQVRPLGMLERRAELELIESQATGLIEQRDAMRVHVRGLDGEAANIAEQLGKSRKEAEQTRRQLAGDESRLEQAGRDVERLEREAKGLGDEIASMVQRGDAMQAEREAITARAQQLARLLADEQQAAEVVEQRIAEVQREADAASEQITAARISVTRIAEQLSAARRERQRLEWTLTEHTKRSAQLVQAVQARQGALVEHNNTMAEAARMVSEAEQTASGLAAALHVVSAELGVAVAKASELAGLLTAERDASAQIESRWHRLEVSKREGEIKRDNMALRYRDEYGRELEELYREYAAILASDDSAEVTVVAVDHAEASAEVDSLRQQIKKLGHVNLDSIEEEQQLAGRNETLATQVADLDEASGQLVELIEKLKDASRERFRRTFGTIQEHFAGDAGMFRKLFGGGKAEVKLMPVVRDGIATDETDWLESGIEIIARPPGKQPRSISQLSGGEKSMTAVALLMAIFRSKPSCFCVLDEVDAALDDANVDRFCRVVEEFTSMSSFIVITHHKRTMHQADQLFGVTMQERGVSKRVSVRIDQVAADGSIKVEKVEATSRQIAVERLELSTPSERATQESPLGQAGIQPGSGSRKRPRPAVLVKASETLAPMGTGNLGESVSERQDAAAVKRGLASMVDERSAMAEPVHIEQHAK